MVLFLLVFNVFSWLLLLNIIFLFLFFTFFFIFFAIFLVLFLLGARIARLQVLVVELLVCSQLLARRSG